MSQMKVNKIAVLDFGGQYTHLIANRVRRLGVYSEIFPCDTPASALVEFKGCVLSGGPHSVLDEESPRFDPSLITLEIPILGLCYGHQLLAQTLGGKICRGEVREYGRAVMSVKKEADILDGLDRDEQIWMSHGDSVEQLPDGFEVLGSTEDCATAAIGDSDRHWYGLQFHPEVTDTPHGMQILENFLTICGCSRDWDTSAYLEEISDDIGRKCQDKRVFLLVSGGVDSTVAFTLLNTVLGPGRVRGLHIDNGLMRFEESSAIMEYLKAHGFDNLYIEHAVSDFLEALDGVSDPEQKRIIIGNKFIEVKERALEKMGLNAEDWILAQGTIYPDTIESAGSKHADRIKTHHNRVDVILELIERGLVIEPLAQLYKDEVRALGENLGLPHHMVWRHPFPGPGLGVRVLCSDGTVGGIDDASRTALTAVARQYGYKATILPIRSVGVQGDGRTYAHPALLSGQMDWECLESLSTKITNSLSAVNRVIYKLAPGEQKEYRLIAAYMTHERLEKLREIDDLITKVLHQSGEYDSIWQMPVVLLPLINENDEECVVLRPIVSQEAMTARFVPLKLQTIDKIVEGALSMKGIGDIFFDITHKPPGTIEWE